MKKLLAGALVAGTMAIGFFGQMSSAAALDFTAVINSSFGSTENTGSSAQLNFDFEQQGTDVLLNLGILNDTSLPTTSTLVGVAFNLPGVSIPGYDPNGTAFTQLFTPADLPPLGTFDIGIRSEAPGGNFAGGNPTAGLTNGQSAVVKLLFAAQSENSLSSAFQTLLSDSGNLVGRFQQVNDEESDKVGGGIPSTPVPTPALLPGLIGMGVAALRKKKREDEEMVTQEAEA